jgi:hypothetical protein
MLSTRRNVAIALTATAATVPLAACNGTSLTPEQVADFIKQVQSKVATACAVAGAVVPEANAVLALLVQLAGGNAGVITAAMIAQAVTAIVGQVCPPAKLTTTLPGSLKAPTDITVNGTVVTFIKFG